MANVRNISVLGTDMVNPTNHPSNQWGNDVPGPLREIGSPKNNPKNQKVQDAKFHKPRSLLGALYFICWIYHQNIYTIFPGFHWPWSRFSCPEIQANQDLLRYPISSYIPYCSIGTVYRIPPNIPMSYLHHVSNNL